ncbi:MAG: hypothetical protein U0M06_14635 [Clostridia bacterium]|nr:hypothetical protein [Clostridia bacterium]
MKIKRKPMMPKKTAMRILKLGLPIISASLIALTVNFRTDALLSPEKAIATYPDMYSHILSTLFILIVGAMFFDIVEKRK